MDNTGSGLNPLDKSLYIFFTDALRITLKKPSQAISFIKSLAWLRKAAKIRKKWKKQGYLIPPILMLSVTNECNLNCAGCYNKSFYNFQDDELRDEELWEIAAQAKELGVSFFVIAGGEPFLKPVVLDIMSAYPEIIFLVFTNGTLIDEVKIAQFMRQKNVVPMISLEGNQEDTDRRRGEGMFAQLQDTMTTMQQRSIFFGLSLTLVRDNFATITEQEFIGRCARMGCKFFLFLEYTPTQPGTEDWVLTHAQRAQVRVRMQSYRKMFPSLFIAVPWDEDDVGGCLSAGRGFVHINARGDLEPCPFAPFSDVNVRRVGLRDAFQSKLCERIRSIPELARETGGGCVLWKERALVQSLLEELRTETIEY